MTLRRRTALAVLVGCALAVIVLYFALQSILTGRTAILENKRTQQDLELALNALDQDIASLETVVRDRASRDDTYQFVQDGNAEYVVANLQTTTLANLGINFAVFVDSAGQIVYSKCVDLSTETDASLPFGLEHYATGDRLLARHDSETSAVAGILLLPEHLAVVASCPILTSRNEGPIVGSLVMGRYLDSAELLKLSELTDLALELHRVDETDIPPDFQAARSSFSENETSVVRVLDDEMLGAYMLVKSIDGSPAFVLGIDEPREVHAQTQQSTFHVLYLLLGFGLLFSVLLFFGVDAAVLSRVRRLSNSVYAVNKNQSSSERLSVGGKDEVTAVAEAVNNALTSLERSQRDLAESKARNQALVETIPDLVFAVDQEGRFTKIGRSQEWDLSDEMISLISTQIREMAMPHVTTALVSRQTQVFRFQLTIDGRESYHEARVSASSDHDALMLVRDVTERELGGQERRNALLVEKIYDRVKSLHSSLQSAASGKCGSRVEEDTPSCPEPTDRSQQDADTGGVNWSSGGSTIESEPASTIANAMAQRER